jgi:hypothetical protein
LLSECLSEDLFCSILTSLHKSDPDAILYLNLRNIKLGNPGESAGETIKTTR